MGQRGVPRGPLWSDADVAYLRERYERQEQLSVIAQGLGRPYKAVSAKASKLGLASRQRPRPWSGTEDAYLVKNYESTPTLEIANALGRSHGTIKRRADCLGLLSAKRRMSAAIRHDYFAQIDSPIKAYVLGVWAADGWVSGDSNEIGIGLHPKDEGLLVLLRDEIAPLSRIMTHARGTRLDLRVSSARMKADLAQLGVVPRKSLTLPWPIGLPQHLENSFICGCFDGDGCLWWAAKRRYYQWSLVCASRPFLEEVRDRIRAATNVKIQGPHGVANGSRALRISYMGPMIYALDEWLHADVTGLARKRPTPAP